MTIIVDLSDRQYGIGAAYDAEYRTFDLLILFFVISISFGFGEE